MISKAFFEDKVKVEDINYSEHNVKITIKSKSKGYYCPKCGCYSMNPHSKYIRKVLDMPMINKQTILFVIVRRFYCKNKHCSQVAFSEQFHDLFEKYHRRTTRLSNFILKLALSQTANQLSRILSDLISISSSTLLRIAKHYKIKGNYTVTAIGIDDFSFKKGINFGTLICDLETNKPIDLINSRELKEVSEHLSNYSNVKIVSRDRSTTYAAAISTALPNATHVADRFHIIHNLMEASSDFLKGYIGKGIKFDKIDLDEFIINTDTNVSDAKASKYGLIEQVKNLHKSGMAIRRIVKEVGISRNTVRKYVAMEVLDHTYSSNSVKKHDIYHSEIVKLLKAGKTYEQISNELKEKGISYSYSSVAKYCSKLKKSNNIKDIACKKLITRYTLLKYFWSGTSIAKSEDEPLIKEAMKKYPRLNDLAIAIGGFSDIFKCKSKKMLSTWINYHKNSEIKEIRSFVNGIIKDYKSVENAVTYNYSNGVLEGNVNRLKMIKRSMYGRAGFHLLRQKVLFHC